MGHPIVKPNGLPGKKLKYTVTKYENPLSTKLRALQKMVRKVKDGTIVKTSRLGGVMNFYERRAA